MLKKNTVPLAVVILVLTIVLIFVGQWINVHSETVTSVMYVPIQDLIYQL